MAIAFKRAVTRFKSKFMLATKDLLIKRGRKPTDPRDLSRAQKRAYREKLQQLHASLRKKLYEMQDARRKTKGLRNPKNRPRVTRYEEALAEDVEFQSGKDVVLGVSAAVAVAAGAHKLSQTADVVSNAVNTASSSLTSFIKAMEEAITGFIHNLQRAGGSLWKVALALLAYWIMQKLGINPLVAIALEGLVFKFAPEVKEYCFGSGEIQAQSGVSDAASFIAMVCTCWIPGKDTKAVTGEFLKRAGYFPRATEGLESFLKKGLEMMERFINFVLRKEGDNLIRFTSETNAFEVWVSKTIAHLKSIAKNPTLQVSELIRIREHYILGFGFYEVLVTESSKRELKGWMEKLALALRPHEGAISKRSNVRPLPACVMIGGESGVGKTSLIRYMASMILLLAKETNPKEALGHLWQKGTTQFWNGWVGQKCLVIDDAFQVKPKPGDMDSEAMQMIRAIGNWSYPLNFADVESKGKFYLNTPLIVGTTNCANIQAQWEPFITNPDALVRRFQYSYWVRLNNSYKDESGRFDYERVRKLVNTRLKEKLELCAKGGTFTTDEILDIVPWDAWNIIPHKFNNSTVEGEPYSGGVKDMIRTVAATIIARKEANEEEVDDLDSILDLLDKAVESQAGRYENVTYSMSDDDVRECVRLTQEEPIATPDDMNDICRYDSMDDVPAMEESNLVLHVNVDGAQFKDATMRGGNHKKLHQDLVAELRGKLDEKHLVVDEMSLTTRRNDRVARAQRQFRGTLRTFADCFRSWSRQLIDWLFSGTKSNTSICTVIQTVGIKFLIGCAVRLAVASVSMIGQLIGRILGFRDKRNEIESQSNVGNGAVTKKEAKFEFASADAVLPSMQMGTPPQEGAADKVYNNTFKMVVSKDGVHVPLGQVIGLGSDVILFPRHFLRELKDKFADYALTFYHAKPTSSYKLVTTVAEFLKLEFRSSPEYDIAATHFGNGGLRHTRDITRLFIPQDKVKKLLRSTRTQVHLQVCQWDMKDGKSVTSRDRLTSPSCEYVAHALKSEQGDSLKGTVKYIAPTRKGDCGAPLMLTEAAGACVLGFHSAGRTVGGMREGFGTIVTQEVVIALMWGLCGYTDGVENHYGSTMRELTDAEEVKYQSAGLVGGSMYAIGMLNEPISMGTVSKLKPSAMQVEQVLGPSPSGIAQLRPVQIDEDVIYPMRKAIEAYQSDQVHMDPDNLVSVVDMAMKPHRAATAGCYRGILTFEEALQPDEYMKLKPLNRTSSPGYKYRDEVTPSKPGKTFALGHEGDIDFSRKVVSGKEVYANRGLQRVSDDVDHIITSAKKGERVLHLCTDFLKDELRPNEKVKNVQTRAISGTPMDYTVAVRMYFGAFMAACFDTYVENGMAPGINHYKEWGRLAEKLLSKGDAMFDGDFSRFDASEQPWVHEAILRYINAWYGKGESWDPEHDRIREILWLDLTHSRHITGLGNVLGLVMQWNKALPSGHPLTTIVNSMYSLITLSACYVSLTGKYDMWDHCYVCTFGDDNVSSVDEQTRDVFNQVSVAREMKVLFNLDYTPGNKSGELYEWTDIYNITFLKRSFMEDEVDNNIISRSPFLGWVAPLAKESFLFEGYWYKNARDPMGDVSARLEHTLCELALHPRSVWDEYAPRIVAWGEKNGVDFEFTTREACRHHVKTRFDVWF